LKSQPDRTTMATSPPPQGRRTPVKTVNRLNRIWNSAIMRFHDESVRLDVRWMVNLSVWALDRLTWTLPEGWQLVDGIPLREYRLTRELEVAQHQIRYYADYAHELQWQILELNLQKEEPREEIPPRGRPKNPALQPQ